MTEAKTLRHRTRTVNPSQGIVREIKLTEAFGMQHVACEVSNNGRVSNASHRYPVDQKDADREWKAAENWLKSDDPRLFPHHYEQEEAEK